MQGAIKFFRPDNGYGLIVPDQPGLPDFLFHFSQVAEVSQVDLQPGTRVEFEPSKVRTDEIGL